MSKKSKIITGLGAASTLAAATDFFLCRTLFDQTLNRKKLKKGKQLSLADADLNDEQKTRRHKELLLCKKWIQNVAVDKVSVESEDGLQLVGMIYPSHDIHHTAGHSFCMTTPAPRRICGQSQEPFMNRAIMCLPRMHAHTERAKAL